jgi:hypothetical protein
MSHTDPDKNHPDPHYKIRIEYDMSVVFSMRRWSYCRKNMTRRRPTEMGRELSSGNGNKSKDFHHIFRELDLKINEGIL